MPYVFHLKLILYLYRNIKIKWEMTTILVLRKQTSRWRERKWNAWVINSLTKLTQFPLCWVGENNLRNYLNVTGSPAPKLELYNKTLNPSIMESLDFSRCFVFCFYFRLKLLLLTAESFLTVKMVLRVAQLVAKKARDGFEIIHIPNNYGKDLFTSLLIYR